MVAVAALPSQPVGAAVPCRPLSTVAALTTYLREAARAYITPLVERHATAMGLGYKSIKMSGARKRWGSCSATNNLNFSWRLIMCPPQCVEYVVVHELCHITHKDHSAAFWAAVAREFPTYRTALKLLKENNAVLDLL
jgi:predicted metal-dependent hydrolase